MNNRTDILNELKNISPLVAAIGKENVFSVPDGYFESVIPTVLLSVKDDLPKQEEISVPDGYFDNLAGNILNKIKSQQQENADETPAFFSQIREEQPFEIPAGYFETLSSNILSLVKNSEGEIMPAVFEGLSKTTPLEVPDGYFETLSDTILFKIKLGEVEQLPPVFEGLSKAVPFKVPNGYFDELPNNILAKVKAGNGAKVVKMPARFTVLKYAAAAVFTGALALGIYKFSGNDTSHPATQTAALDPSIEKGKAMDEKSFTESLDNLSEEAIVKYLEKNGSEADVSALTSSMENTVLPEEEDYLLDDNTLDDFLKELKNNSN